MPHTIIAIFRSLSDAHAAQVALDMEQIDSELGGEVMTGADPFAALRPGSVQLLVPVEVADNARGVLRASGYGEAIERVERMKSSSSDTSWHRMFQIGGLMVALFAVILLVATDNPNAWTLLGLGVLLWGIGLLASPSKKKPEAE